MRRRHELTDQQWERIEHLLPGRKPDPGQTARDNRLFLNAVFWIAKTGAPWRDLPERFGNWNSTFRRFSRWCRNGVWGKLLKALGGDAELEVLLVDSTIVRTHQHASGGKVGRHGRPLAARVED